MLMMVQFRVVMTVEHGGAIEIPLVITFIGRLPVSAVNQLLQLVIHVLAVTGNVMDHILMEMVVKLILIPVIVMLWTVEQTCIIMLIPVARVFVIADIWIAIMMTRILTLQPAIARFKMADLVLSAVWRGLITAVLAKLIKVILKPVLKPLIPLPTLCFGAFSMVPARCCN